MRFVISSSWRGHVTREQLQRVLRGAGLEFVADGMFADERWQTPLTLRCDRQDEIERWLDKHGAGAPFVILDDPFSGRDLRLANGNPLEHVHGRVILCKEKQGLRGHHVEPILRALRTPAAKHIG